MKTPTLPQAVQVLNLVAQQKPSSEQLQKIIDAGLFSDLLKANTDKIDRNEFRKILGLTPLEFKDDRFGPAIREFEITVPANYNHDTWLDTFGEKTKKLKNTSYYNNDLTSENFAKATSKLVPGKKYKAKFIPILKPVSSEDYLKRLLQEPGAVLTGAHGLMLTHDLQSDQFPVGWTLSFDEKEALWEDADGRHRVPDVYRYSVGDWDFNLHYFERDWDGDRCLLCLCDA